MSPEAWELPGVSLTSRLIELESAMGPSQAIGQGAWDWLLSLLLTQANWGHFMTGAKFKRVVHLMDMSITFGCG